MNPTPFNPDNWIDLVAYLIIGIPATVAALATYRASRRQQKDHKAQKEVADQTLFEVRNDHPTNLRDDITDISICISEGFAELRHEVGVLREELRHERVERVEGDRRRLL